MKKYRRETSRYCLANHSWRNGIRMMAQLCRSHRPMIPDNLSATMTNPPFYRKMITMERYRFGLGNTNISDFIHVA